MPHLLDERTPLSNTLCGTETSEIRSREGAQTQLSSDVNISPMKLVFGDFLDCYLHPSTSRASSIPCHCREIIITRNIEKFCVTGPVRVAATKGFFHVKMIGARAAHHAYGVKWHGIELLRLLLRITFY